MMMWGPGLENLKIIRIIVGIKISYSATAERVGLNRSSEADSSEIYNC